MARIGNVSADAGSAARRKRAASARRLAVEPRRARRSRASSCSSSTTGCGSRARSRSGSSTLYRQTKVVGGLFRSLGQEADAVGSAYALERRDILSPLIRNLGSMLVKGATPVEILKQYMAKGDSPTRGRELNIHFGDTERGFIGQISPLGDMVPVMAGVTLTFKMRSEDRVGLVYVGDGATSTGAFHEGINFAAVQRCPLVVIVENNGYAYSTPTSQADGREAVRRQGDRLRHSRRAGRRQRRPRVVRRRRSAPSIARARRRRDARRADDVSPQGTRRARQSVVRAGGRDRAVGARERSDRRATSRGCATSSRSRTTELEAIDERVRREVDEATDVAERSASPEALDALVGVYADPPAEQPLWFREGKGGVVEKHERPEGWGTFRRVRRETRLMAEITYLEAIREALFEEMERDAERLLPRRGHRRVRRRVQGHRRTDRRSSARQRVIDTPISEIGIVGAAAGAAHMGMRPVVEMQFIDFIANAYDMLTNYVATARYRAFLPCPMVVRGPSGGYVRGGPFHSQNPEAGFIHTPGLKVVYPATAEDAKGLMKAAIRDDDCVLFFEHKYLYRRIKGEMPAGDHVVPIGKARIAREGQGPLDHHVRRDGLEGARGGGAAREGGRAVGRGDRPALAGAARRRGDPGHGAEDEPRADRPRGHAHGRDRRRDHGAHQRDARSRGSTRRSCG